MINYNEESKLEILNIISSDNFKNLFLNRNIHNVIIFGSFTSDEFNEESDIDIAIVGREKLNFKDELSLTLELESLLGREIDLIDINDDNINNLIKIAALNSKFIVLEDNILEETINSYDRLYKENEEFWFCLDREVLNFE